MKGLISGARMGRTGKVRECCYIGLQRTSSLHEEWHTAVSVVLRNLKRRLRDGDGVSQEVKDMIGHAFICRKKGVNAWQRKEGPLL